MNAKSMAVQLFLWTMVVASVALGVSALISAVNGTPASSDLHALLITPVGNVVAIVVALIVAVGGSVFWYQETLESAHNE